jgi:hypothetical protein
MGFQAREAMLKRFLNPRFNDPVLEGRKITTIRDQPWRTDLPVMLYNWSGEAYRSKQIDVAAVQVIDVRPVRIDRTKSGAMVYRYSTGGDEQLVKLWECEGFNSQEEMDEWFAAKMKPGQSVTKCLMRFRLVFGGFGITTMKKSIVWKDMKTSPEDQFASELGYSGNKQVAQVVYARLPEITVKSADRCIKFTCNEVNLAKRLAEAAYEVISATKRAQ